MEVRILGSLEVVRDGSAIPLGGRQQQAVLVALVLERGGAVSVDRLADLLWGDDPPPTTTKTVQVYVSQLRKLLGDGVLLTRGPGYALDPARYELDAQRFEDALERGREELAGGLVMAAAATLRDALDLWHGSPLADFADEPFARAEIGRLDELRLAALEERIEADLRRGRGGELVSELEVLVDRHPFRERFRGQLMLALYRAGRQADALASYRQTREHLVEELGLEPSRQLQELERAILNQDPMLDAAPAPRPVPPARSRRRRTGMVVASAMGLVVAAVAVPAALRGAEHRAVVVTANSVVAIDPAGNKVVGAVPVGGAPSSVAAGEGAVWVINADDHTVTKVDPTSMRAVRTISTAAEPTDLAVGDGAVWVGDGVPVTSSEFWATLDPIGLTRIDPASAAVAERLSFPQSAGGDLVRRATGQRQIAVGAGSVWSAEPDGSLWRTGRDGTHAVAPGAGLEARALAFDDRGLWVVGDSEVALVDPVSEAVDLKVPIATIALGAVAAAAGTVWVTDPIAGSLWRIAGTVSPVASTVAVGAGAWSVATGLGAVWVANSLDNTVLRVDPALGQVVARIPLGATPHEIAVGSGRVWVTVGDVVGGDALSGAPASKVTGAVRSSSCGPVSFGGQGSPDVLIASDLPLQTGQRGVTFPMTQAIEFVLARHHFRAGRYTVGYQSCDDSTAQSGGWDEARCTGNAEQYAAARRVVAVIGPYHSGCAALELPVLNRAEAGPLALVSPANSWPGLTRSIPEAEPGELDQLYPTGVRNYARVATSDDFQAAADAELAKDLGARHVLLVQEAGADQWIQMIAGAFRRAAGGLGIEVARSLTWTPDAPNVDSLESDAAAARPDAVFVAGVVFDGAGPLIKALRTALGSSVPIIAADGFASIPYLRQVAGDAATGMYVSVLGEPDQNLGPAGRRFVRAFADTQPAGVPSYTAAYGAQAAELVLAAIARSDGSRPSVAKEIFRTRFDNGILGSFRIDGNGDPTLQPVTILRVTGDAGQSPTRLADHAGAAIDRVITPDAALMRGGGSS